MTSTYQDPLMRSPDDQDRMEGPSSSASDAQGPVIASANRKYPPPPPYYTSFTNAAWSKFKKRRKSEQSAAPLTEKDNGETLEESGAATDDNPEKKGVEDIVEAQHEDIDALEELFQPPRVDWIVEEGGWQAFGENHQIEPHIFTAQELGIPDFRPPDTNISTQDYAQLLLRSLLHTKLKLLEALSKPMRPVHEVNQDGLNHQTEPYVAHMANLSATMMTLANELRPLQSRLTLESMMQDQLDRRKKATEDLRAENRRLAKSLQELKEKMKDGMPDLRETTAGKVENGGMQQEVIADTAP